MGTYEISIIPSKQTNACRPDAVSGMMYGAAIARPRGCRRNLAETRDVCIGIQLEAQTRGMTLHPNMTWYTESWEFQETSVAMLCVAVGDPIAS